MNWDLLTNGEKRCIINENQRRFNMKPRVFVSSTFYDLKYVREDLANFIRSRDFEPIMFEDGDVGYESGKPLDDSCYEAMRNADMAILIIGGQHGTNASKQNETDIQEFISITNKEFSSAVNAGIPVFAFVDAKVNVEYEIYKENIDKIKENPKYINFRATKDIRVFDFIRSIYNLGNVPLNDFNKISDIKDFLAKQWSDMFKKHLSTLKGNKEIETVKSSISKLESIVNKMSVMMDAIGKNVLKESNEYETIKNRQRAQEICDSLKNVITLVDKSEVGDSKRSEDLINMLADMSNDFIENKFTRKTLFVADESVFYDFLKNHVESHISKYRFKYIDISIEILDLLIKINQDLKNNSVKKEIINLLDEKLYEKIVKNYNAHE